MSEPQHSIRKYRSGWAVYDPTGRRVSGILCHPAAAEKMDERNKTVSFRKRDCMTCRQPFMSEGPHNRMCSRCRSQRRDYEMI